MIAIGLLIFNSSAQSYVGTMFARGFILPQNYAMAESWFRKAAASGNAAAEDGLGYYIYEQGKGSSAQDYAKAAEWDRKAADQGFPPASAI